MKSNFYFTNLLFASVFLLSSCTTKQKPASLGELQQGQWESSFKYLDKKKDKSQSASADIIAHRRGQVRIEVTALLGFPVASLVVTEKNFFCALHTQKAYYYGTADEQNLKKILKLPLSPLLLRQIIFDQPIKVPPGVVVDVQRTEDKRTVILQSQEFEFKWVIDARPTEVEITPATFQLEPPKNYKIFRL